MRIIKTIKSASPKANILALASLLALVLKIVFLNQIPEAFPKAHDLGIIMESILSSIFASYIFYLIVVHLKEQQDRESVNPYISKHCNRIIEHCKSQISAISSHSSTTLAFATLTKQDLLHAMTLITPYSSAPMSFIDGTNANWLQYFYSFAEKTRQSSKRVLDQLPYLEAKTVALVTNIDDCDHFMHIDFASKIQLRNQDLRMFHENFFEYYILCKKLENHLKNIM